MTKPRWMIIGLCIVTLGASSACGGVPLPKLLARPTPTPRCVEPTLRLGATRFVIKTVSPE